jgi:hypothetical protein
MRRRRLTLGGFLVGVILGACLLNCPPDQQGFFTRFAGYSALPLLIVLSPVIFLLTPVGLLAGSLIGHAVSAVLTWTAVGYAADLVANKRK